MLKIPIICCNGIGDSFLILGRVPIVIFKNLGFRFSIFYTTPDHRARRILEPFFRQIRNCDYIERKPTAREKHFFSLMMSLSMKTNTIWRPPIGYSEYRKRKDSPKRILLHTHLDGHPAKFWPIVNWVELAHSLHAKKFHISVIEWNDAAMTELKNHCPFLLDARRDGLLETVKSFSEYDLLFSIDSWSKYAAAWFNLPQIIAVPNLQFGYPGFSAIPPMQVAKWWFHGLIGHRKVKVIGLEKTGLGDYVYNLNKIGDLGVPIVFSAIQEKLELLES
jgi:hypothetical protein